jgi:integrase
MDESEVLRKVREALGMDEPAGGPTFGELWGKYFRAEGRYLDTVRDLKRYEILLCAQWGERPAIRLGPEDLESYRDLRLSQTTRRGKPPAPATVNREVAAARRCLQWAVEQRLLKYNPLAGAAMLPENNIRHTAIRSEAELARLLELADPWMRAIILVQIDCGFRRMEVFSLVWSQIVLVPHLRADGEEALRPMVQLRKTKNGSRRRAALSQRTYDAIQALPRWCERFVFVGRKPGRFRGEGSGPVPVPGTHLSPDATLRKFQRLCERVGLHAEDGGKFHFHDLRHSFAYLMRVRDRASAFAVKLQGGWKTNSAFERYGIGGEEELADMYDRVDASIAKHAAKPKPPR